MMPGIVSRDGGTQLKFSIERWLPFSPSASRCSPHRLSAVWHTTMLQNTAHVVKCDGQYDMDPRHIRQVNFAQPRFLYFCCLNRNNVKFASMNSRISIALAAAAFTWQKQHRWEYHRMYNKRILRFAKKILVTYPQLLTMCAKVAACFLHTSWGGNSPYSQLSCVLTSRRPGPMLSAPCFRTYRGRRSTVMRGCRHSYSRRTTAEQKSLWPDRRNRTGYYQGSKEHER